MLLTFLSFFAASIVGGLISLFIIFYIGGVESSDFPFFTLGNVVVLHIGLSVLLII